MRDDVIRWIVMMVVVDTISSRINRSRHIRIEIIKEQLRRTGQYNHGHNSIVLCRMGR